MSYTTKIDGELQNKIFATLQAAVGWLLETNPEREWEVWMGENAEEGILYSWEDYERGLDVDYATGKDMS
jgi:hypothetical protein